MMISSVKRIQADSAHNINKNNDDGNNMLKYRKKNYIDNSNFYSNKDNSNKNDDDENS